jgi:hypothetical protein
MAAAAVLKKYFMIWRRPGFEHSVMNEILGILNRPQAPQQL